MTPSPALPSTSRMSFDLPLPKSPYVVEENSPAFYQSLRNKQRLAMLEKYDESSKNLPTLQTTPLTNRRDAKLRTPFKVPFIDRLKKASE